MVDKKSIAVGDEVKLTLRERRRSNCPEFREDNRTAKVKALLTDIDGGLYMDRDLHGCRYWNVEHVQVVKKTAVECRVNRWHT